MIFERLLRNGGRRRLSNEISEISKPADSESQEKGMSIRKFNSDGTSILISIEAIKEHLGKNQDFCRDFRGSHQSISIRVKERDKKYLEKLEFITNYLEDT